MNTQETLEYAGTLFRRASVALTVSDERDIMSKCKAASVGFQASQIARSIGELDRMVARLESSPEDPVALQSVQAYATAFSVQLDFLELTLTMTL